MSRILGSCYNKKLVPHMSLINSSYATSATTADEQNAKEEWIMVTMIIVSYP